MREVEALMADNSLRRAYIIGKAKTRRGQTALPYASMAYKNDQHETRRWQTASARREHTNTND